MVWVFCLLISCLLSTSCLCLCSCSPVVLRLFVRLSLFHVCSPLRRCSCLSGLLRVFGFFCTLVLLFLFFPHEASLLLLMKDSFCSQPARLGVLGPFWWTLNSLSCLNRAGILRSQTLYLTTESSIINVGRILYLIFIVRLSSLLLLYLLSLWCSTTQLKEQQNYYNRGYRRAGVLDVSA